MKHLPLVLLLSICTLGILLLSGCQPTQELDTGRYTVLQGRRRNWQQTWPVDTSVKKVYILPQGDSLHVRDLRSARTWHFNSAETPMNVHLLRTEFDFDIYTSLFKIRGATTNVPSQFNTNFNALLYFGVKQKYIQLREVPTPANRLRNAFTYVGVTSGVVVGLGNAQITPTNTDMRTLQEYDGVVLSYGWALAYDVKRFNVGLALGTDYLLNGDRSIWIYNNQLWYAFIIGVNLN